MEALVFDAKSMKLTYHKNYRIPEIVRSNDVKVKVAYSGVCGTDLHIMQGEFPCNKERPIVMGHEFSGVIIDAGPKSKFVKGQKVVVDPNSPCNKCDFCRSASYQYCLTCGINDNIGIFKDGGWAEYAVVPDTSVYVIPDSITLEQAGLCEPYSCVVHGYDVASPITIGDRILVLGAGIIGNLWMSLLHLHGHKDVTVSEVNTVRLNLAKKLETGYRMVTPDVLADEGILYDVIIDCTGSARALEISIDYANHGGKYILFGCAPPGHDAKIKPFDFYLKELRLLAVKINPYTFVKSINILKTMGDRYLNYNRLGVKTYQLSDYQKVLDELKSGIISKAIFKLA